MFLMRMVHALKLDRKYNNTIRIVGELIFYQIKLTTEKSIVIRFESDYDISGSCYGLRKEELIFKFVLISTLKNCDGPGLEYEKVK